MENNQTYYIDLITKYFSGEADRGEMEALAGWLKSNPENQKIFEGYHKTWSLIAKSHIEKVTDTDKEWNELKARMNFSVQKEAEVIRMVHEEKPQGFQFMKLLRIAAVVFIAAVSSFFIYHYVLKPADITVVAEAKTIEKKLPDNSEVTLNAGSTIEYPKQFADNRRVVKLRGEAYFNVTHNKARPFIVSAGEAKIEVLGTSFYVNTNTANGDIEVVLTEGKVAVYFKDQKQILNPGEKTVVSVKEEKIQAPEPAGDENYMAFKTKKLIFNNTELREVVKVLNNVYHANIMLKDKKLEKVTYTNTFDNQSMESVLHVLEINFDLKIRKSASQIEISCK